jgi:protocatechuate 3,4-dioxygenase beta subunit
MNRQSMLPVTRRGFLGGLSAVGVAAWTAPGAFAEALSQTPRTTEGPFYPDRMPLDTDNDLIVVNDKLTPAVGEITHLSGRILSPSGEPLRNAVIEIWQVDANGAYLHSRSGNGDSRDANFQGFGRFLTASDGRYYFRTIKPVPYPGRTPHIHFLVRQGDKRLLTSQFFVKGLEQNERDGVLRGVDPKLRELLMLDFQPLQDAKTGELVAQADVIVGLTPEEPERGGPGGRPGQRPPGGRPPRSARPPAPNGPSRREE